MLCLCSLALSSCMPAICSVASKRAKCRCVLCCTLRCCLVSVTLCAQDRLSAKHELLCHVERAQAELSAKLQAAGEQVQASDARLAQSQVGIGTHNCRPVEFQWICDSYQAPECQATHLLASVLDKNASLSAIKHVLLCQLVHILCFQAARLAEGHSTSTCLCRWSLSRYK